MSSRWAASSSMARSLRSAPVTRACCRTSVFQSVRGLMMPSRVPHARHLTQRFDESLPVLALVGEHLAAGFGDAVVTAPALAGLLDPSPLDPLAVFHAVQRGVERGEGEADRPAGSLVDQAGDFIAVTAAIFEKREDDDFSASFFGSLDG